jgi:hypothetical protein
MDETNAELKDLEKYYNQLPELYTAYILSLIKAQEEEKKAEGLI